MFACFEVLKEAPTLPLPRLRKRLRAPTVRANIHSSSRPSAVAVSSMGMSGRPTSSADCTVATESSPSTPRAMGTVASNVRASSEDLRTVP